MSLRSLRSRFTAVAAALAVALPGTAQAATFPRLEADSLGGTHVVLPTDAAGKPFVLVIAYTPESENQVTAWSRKLIADRIADHAVLYVVVVADRTAPFLRKRVYKIVGRAAVGSDEQKRRSVLVTFSGTGWHDLMGPGPKDTAGIVACDASGTIVFAKREPLTDANAAAIEQAAK